jgi:hypothetical protein
LRECDKCHQTEERGKALGIVSLKDFKRICRTTKFLTPKESNLLIRNLKDEWVDLGGEKYTKLSEMIYEVRF